MSKRIDFARLMNARCKEIFELAKSKGWYDEPRSALAVHMLIVSEIAEATEEVRKGTPNHYYLEDDMRKPEGELIELADAVIRIMDYCGSKGWDLGSAIEIKSAYNATRPYKHGKKC